MIEPIKIKAGEDKVLLGPNQQPPLVDIRVVSEDYYQKMLRFVQLKGLEKEFKDFMIDPLQPLKERLVQWLMDEYPEEGARQQIEDANIKVYRDVVVVDYGMATDVLWVDDDSITQIY